MTKKIMIIILVSSSYIQYHPCLKYHDTGFDIVNSDININSK